MRQKKKTGTVSGSGPLGPILFQMERTVFWYCLLACSWNMVLSLHGEKLSSLGYSIIFVPGHMAWLPTLSLGLAPKACPYGATNYRVYGYYTNVGAVPTTQLCFYAIGLTAPSYGSSYVCLGVKEHPVWGNEPLPTIKTHITQPLDPCRVDECTLSKIVYITSFHHYD